MTYRPVAGSAGQRLDDYVSLWMKAIGVAPFTALIEVAGGFSVPDRDIEDSRVRALTEITWTLVGWDNDLYSRNKELLRAGDNLNLIDVLCQELRCDPYRALVRAVAMRDRVMVLFNRLTTQVLKGADDPLHRYVQGLGQFVRGHLDWASVCPRYTVPSVSEEPGAWWKQHPSDDSAEPLRLSTISWWWDQLDTSR